MLVKHWEQIDALWISTVMNSFIWAVLGGIVDMTFRGPDNRHRLNHSEFLDRLHRHNRCNEILLYDVFFHVHSVLFLNHPGYLLLLSVCYTFECAVGISLAGVTSLASLLYLHCLSILAPESLVDHSKWLQGHSRNDAGCFFTRHLTDLPLRNPWLVSQVCDVVSRTLWDVVVWSLHPPS